MNANNKINGENVVWTNRQETLAVVHDSRARSDEEAYVLFKRCLAQNSDGTAFREWMEVSRHESETAAAIAIAEELKK